MAQEDAGNPGTAFQQADQILPPKRDFITRLGTALNEGHKGSPMDQALQAHNQRRTDEAQMHHQNASTSAGTLYYDTVMQQKANADPAFKAAAAANPSAAQSYNGYTFLTPDERQSLQTQHDSAMDAYEKIVGVDKNTKSALQKARGIVGHLIQHGNPALGASASQVQAGNGQSNMTPPPAAPGAQTATPSPPQGASGTTPFDQRNETTGLTVPPPAPGTPLNPNVPPDRAASGQSGVGSTASSTSVIPLANDPMSYEKFSQYAPFMRQQLVARMEDDRAQGNFRSEEDYKHSLRMQELMAHPDKYEVHTVRQKDGSDKLVAVDKSNPRAPTIDVKNASGEIEQPGEKHYANEGRPEVIAGIPTGGVFHHGRVLHPWDKEYTPQDAATVAAGMGSANLSQKQKEQVQRVRAAAWAQNQARYKYHSVIDKDTGEAEEVSALDMAKDPGRYGAPSEQEKIAQREAVHQSLRVNFGAMNKALEDLPNGLDSKTQAIIKNSLKNDNDSGTISQLIMNRIKTMDPDNPTREEQAQVQYLTVMKALQEDLMTMRQVGGIAGSSDTMRNAIVALAPGPSTASTMEAKMQLAAASRTLEALFSGRPVSQIGPGRKKGFPTPSGGKSGNEPRTIRID